MTSGIESRENGKPSQGELPLGLPKENTALLDQELTKQAESIFDDYVVKALPILFTMVANGEGKQKLEVVVGNKKDKRSVIDLTAHHLFLEAVKRQNEKQNVPFAIFGEESFESSKDIEKKEKFLVFPEDPIENSDPYLKGIKGAGIYSVIAALNQDGKALMGIAIDIENAAVLVTKDGKNILKRYEMVEKSNGEPKHIEFVLKSLTPKSSEEVFPSKRKTLNDPDARFYTFMGEKRWGKLAIKEFLPNLFEIEDDKTYNELSRGGSHIYPFFLANGRGEGYGIPEEPVSEVFPALPSIIASGITVLNVNKDGTITPIVMNPREFIQNPLRYQEESINFLVAGVTPEIAHEIASSYLDLQRENAEAKKRKVELERELTELREFRNSRPREEFEVFRASQQPKNPSSN
jgi:hypothetical protein